MAAGLPVIAAQASCLPEIYEDAALFFDPHDPVDLGDKILSIKSDPLLRKSLITAGHKQVKNIPGPKWPAKHGKFIFKSCTSL